MKRNNSVLNISRNMSVTQNVSFRVLDSRTGNVVQEHIGHNSATNSLLTGIANHLVGDFLPSEGAGMNPNYEMLANYVPRYISLGTMGLIDQEQDAHGLPAGIGDNLPDTGDEEYAALLAALEAAKAALDAAKAALADECPHYPYNQDCKDCTECFTRREAKQQAVADAQAAYDAAYEAAMSYNEEARFIDYMKHRPGYGADGYDPNENNDRDYAGLGYAFTGYNVSRTYTIGDTTTFKGTIYKCIVNTPTPAGVFNIDYWEALPDDEQPSKGTTVKLELISPSFPREQIAYRDVVPEYEAELPCTIDVVFSAMISTGALKQFRPDNQDFIFITEAGLWSRQEWENNGDNGLLAGYRIVPPNKENWDMTDPANRDILKRQILKVGKNQVVQVIWKIQIAAIEGVDVDKSETVLGPKTILDNGVYNPRDDGLDGYSQVNVSVPSTPLDTLTVTENNIYYPEPGRAFGEVDVNVPATPLNNLVVTENGVYVPAPGTGFNEVEVDVPSSGGDFSSVIPVEFYYRDTDTGEEGDTPEHNLVLSNNAYYYNHSNHWVGYPDSYTYWNPETKYIEITRDFDAVLQYTLHGYRDSYNYAQGALYYNDERIAFLQALYNRYTSVYIPLSLKEGDTLAIRKPEDYGWSYHELFINMVIETTTRVLAGSNGNILVGSNGNIVIGS